MLFIKFFMPVSFSNPAHIKPQLCFRNLIVLNGLPIAFEEKLLMKQ